MRQGSAHPSATYDIAPFTTANPDKTWTFTYTWAVTVVPDTCTTYTYTNTATVTDGDTNADNSSSASVTVCGPASGGLTMGFWQNNNGQGIIKSYCIAGTGTGSLNAYLTGLNPFKDMTATTCANEATYVYNTIKAAKCSSTDQTCNTMLKAQMLATALDVFFSQPGWDKIKPFNGNNGVSLGGVKIDLSKVCSMIDGSGGATCSGSESAVPEFNQPSATISCQSVSDLLSFSNATALVNFLWGNKLVSNSGGSSWYNQKKAYQVPAKDTFDTINNSKALTCQ